MNNRGRDALLLGAASVGALLAVRAAAERWNEHKFFQNKTVLVTGGSRGLGLVMARQLVSEGARVAICARDPAELERARRELQQRGGQSVLAVPCDVTDKAQVRETVSIVQDRFGSIDVLINNAGLIQVGPVKEMTLEDYKEAMNTNFYGPLHTTLAVLPEMQRRRAGRIVNIASIGGKIGIPHLLPYSASKFALVGFSEGLAAELAKDGITVTTVCPGLMRTGSPRNATFKGQHKAEYAWFSIGDSLPLISVSAESAARRIIQACKRGNREVVLPTTAKIAIKFHDLFPQLTTGLLGLSNRALPGAGGIGRRQAKGKDSNSTWSPSLLTRLGDTAAQRNNETA